MGRLLQQIVGENGSKSPDLAYAALAGLGQGAARRKQKLSDLKLDGTTAARLRDLLDSAAATAAARDKSPSQRTAGLNLLSLFDWDAARPVLMFCLDPVEPREVQSAALRGLSSFNEAVIATELISRWRQLTPPLRDEAVGILLSRPILHEALVAALEKGEVPVGQVSIPHRGRLAVLSDKALAERAKAVLAAVALGPRREVIDRYQAALSLKPDAERGRLVYRRECANCHRLNNEGHDVGPNLATIQHRSPQEILIHVFDPNREVSPNFLDYAVRLTDGRVLTGMIASETDAGLTLRRGEQQQDTILRSEIEDIATSGKSLMPDGMEQKITMQEMADLIAYLRNKP